jgi:hypothetical protein
MADNSWAAALNVPPEEAAEFDRLTASMGSSPSEILKMMVDQVLQMDRELGVHGLRGVPGWISDRDAVQAVVDHGVHGLPIDIRPSSFMWPADKPFPWSAEECKAAVIGYEVKWKGDFDDFLKCLRGKWEMSDGYAFLHQS